MSYRLERDMCTSLETPVIGPVVWEEGTKTPPLHGTVQQLFCTRPSALVLRVSEQ